MLKASLILSHPFDIQFNSIEYGRFKESEKEEQEEQPKMGKKIKKNL